MARARSPPASHPDHGPTPRLAMRQRPLASLTLSAALRTPTATSGTEAKSSTPVAMLHGGLRVSAVSVGSSTEHGRFCWPGVSGPRDERQVAASGHGPSCR